MGNKIQVQFVDLIPTDIQARNLKISETQGIYLKEKYRV